MASLNLVDIFLVAIILISIIIGLGRGFVSEVLSLLILIAAFAVAIYFTTPLANYFTNAESVQHAVTVTQTSNTVSTTTTQPPSYVALGICFTLLFVGTLLVGALLKFILNLALSAGGIGVGNRILGGIFGLLRGILLDLVIIFLVQLSPVSNEPWWKASQLVPQFQPGVVWLANIVSPTLANLQDEWGASIENVKENVKNATMGTSPNSSESSNPSNPTPSTNTNNNTSPNQ